MRTETCEAILITNGERRSSKRRPGCVCGEPAVSKRNDHPVCWVHAKAIRDLEFAKVKK